MRLAARHGDPDVRNFAADLGLSFSKVLAGHDAERLARLAGIDWCELARFTPDIDVRSRTVELAGDRLLLNDWSVRARRWCPLCLREDRAMLFLSGSRCGWRRGIERFGIFARSGAARCTTFVCLIPAPRAGHGRISRDLRSTAVGAGWIYLEGLFQAAA
jgi:hypothetical protein